jgi:uncharacterized protein
MTQTETSKSVLQRFFSAFGAGDVEALVACFHPDAEITAVRRQQRQEGELHGSYSGASGVNEFLSNLGAWFDTKAFAIDHMIAEGCIACASGSFTHHVKPSGKPYQSDWSLVCRIEDDRIKSYRFFEDSAAFARASS